MSKSWSEYWFLHRDKYSLQFYIAFSLGMQVHIYTYISGKIEYLVGETVDYKCAEGFKLQGASNRTCESGGTWNGQAPTCVYVQCGQLSLEG